MVIYHTSASDRDALPMMCGRDEEPWPSRTSHCTSENKHRRDHKRPLMMRNSGLCTSSKKWIKIGMKTPIRINNKGNDVIICCSLGVWSCLLLSNHHHYMCCRHQCSLQCICASWFNNDNVHQSPEAIWISIHHWVWWGKRWKTSLLRCAPFFKTIVVTISQIMSWAIVHSFPQGHWSKWIHDCLWYDHTNTVKDGQLWDVASQKWVQDVVKKWTRDKRNASVVGQINN